MKKTVSKILALVMALCCMASVFAVSASAGPILRAAVASAALTGAKEVVKSADQLNDEVKYVAIEKPKQEAKDAVNKAKDKAQDKAEDIASAPAKAVERAANRTQDAIHDVTHL